MSAPAATVSDIRALRSAFGCFMTGVTVVTTRDPAGRPLGFTANSFTSVSLDPPLLLVCIANGSANRAAFAAGPGFAVNILAEGQSALSTTFARPSADRFAGLAWQPGPVGAPILEGVAAWFDCACEQALPAGDHTILIGLIGAFAAAAHPALGYYRGAYLTPAATAAQMPTGPEVVIAAILEAEGRVLLLDDDRGGVAVPMARVGAAGVQATLAALIGGLGLRAEPGTIYAVYEDLRRGIQHLAIRCPTRPGPSARGAFVDLTAEGVSCVSDPALREMLTRLAEESRLGNYGVYFGTHEAGRVHRRSEGRAS
ncbi:MAG: flavin reductase family protein [Gemmobacter sp.]